MKTAQRFSLLSLALFAGLLSGGFSSDGLGQIPQPELVRDINQTSSRYSQSSYPDGMTAGHNGFWRHSRYAVVGSHVFLRASEMNTGSELYYADATPGSAVMVMDINPGMNDSAPGNFLVIGNKLYFTADDGANGFQIWEASVGAGGATAHRLTSLSGTAVDTTIGPMIAGKIGGADYIYFTKFDTMASSFVIHAVQLPSGVVTTVPALMGQHWEHPVQIGTRILFEGNDVRGTEAWWLDDNKTAGVLKDYASGDGMCEYPVVIGDKVYFAASSGTWGLYSWDGQDPVKYVAGLPGRWTNPVALGSKIVFEWGGVAHAVDTAAPMPAATPLPNELNGDTFKSAIYDPVVMGGKAYYYGWSWLQPVAAYYLFETDGVTAQLIPGTRNDVYGNVWYHPEVVDDAAIYFNHKSSGAGWSLHKFDGMTMTRFQIHKSTQDSANPFNLTALGDKVVFRAEDGLFGNELWISSGTQAGTMLHTNIATQMRTDGSHPGYFAPVGRRTVFSANDGIHGIEPWILEEGFKPSLSGPRLFADMETGYLSSIPKNFLGVERKDGFLFQTTTPSLKLNFAYMYDHTETVLGADVSQQEWESRYTTRWGEILTLGTDSTHGSEPRRFNPDTVELELLADTNPGAADGGLRSIAESGKKNYALGKENGAGISAMIVWEPGEAATEVSVPADKRPASNMIGMGDRAILYKGEDPIGWSFAVKHDPEQGTFDKFRTAEKQWDNVFEQPFSVKFGMDYRTVFWATEGTEDYAFWTDGIDTGKLSPTGLFGFDRFHNSHTQKEEVAVDLGQTDWKVFFPWVNQAEVWKTDGDTAMRVGSLELSDVTMAIPLGASRVAFVGYTDATGFEVFVTDGMSIYSISESLAPGPADGTHWGAGLRAMNGNLLFSGQDALGVGSELFRWNAGALAQPFGIGTDPRIRFRVADPKIGEMAQFDIEGAPIDSNLAVVVFGNPAPSSFLFGGERVYVDLVGAQAFAIALTQGTGSLEFPLPLQPRLIGLEMVVQAAILPYLNALGMALTYPQMLTVGM